MRLLPYAAIAAVLVLVLFAAFRLSNQGSAGPEAFHGTLIEPAMDLSDFELVSTKGVFAKEDFEGTFSVVTFGFSHCPHICPMTMTRLAKAVSELEQSAPDAELRTVLITVDPARDSAAVIDGFAKQFHPSFTGLSGSEQEIRRAADAFGVYFEKEGEVEDGAAYLMGHSSTVFALNEDAEVVLIWSASADGRQIAEDLQLLLG